MLTQSHLPTRVRRKLRIPTEVRGRVDCSKETRLRSREMDLDVGFKNRLAAIRRRLQENNVHAKGSTSFPLNSTIIKKLNVHMSSSWVSMLHRRSFLCF
jgi:hypothetical protein